MSAAKGAKAVPLYAAPPQRKPLAKDAYRQLMKHAHRLANDGHGELAQYLRDALDNAGFITPCRYPDCVDNGPDGKCTRWLLAECNGPAPAGKKEEDVLSPPQREPLV